jgi:hypothetical protein
MPGVFYPMCLATLKVVFDGFGGADSEPTVVDVRPRTATVHMNGYREADTFELDFDASAFPFSPELVRSMGVELHLFQTSGMDDEVLDPYQEDESLAIAGLVDEAKYHAGHEGRSFHITGRDYTALMIDKQWDATKRVPVGLPLDVVVQQLVDEASHASKTGRILTVKVVGTDSVPTLGAVNSRESALTTAGKYRVSKKGKLKVPTTGKAHVHTNKKGVPQKGGSNYWDVIYRLCIRHGFIVFVRGTDVIISTPQTLTEATEGRLRKVAYGRDLRSLDVERKLGKETVPQIEVTSYDPVTMTAISGKWPDKPKEKTTGIGTKSNETRLVVVHGINDPGELTKLAKMYYDNLARAEGSISFTTKDLKDLDGNDLLFLRPGDPVQLGFDSLNEEEYRSLDEIARYDKLLSLGYADNVAWLIATEYDKIDQFRQPFYTKDVEFGWDVDDGITISVKALNFVSPGRDDAS